MEIAARRLVRFSRGVKKVTFYEKKDLFALTAVCNHIYSVMKYVYTENMFLWLIFSTGLMLIA